MQKTVEKVQKKLCAVCHKPITKYSGFTRFIGNKRIYLHYGECERNYIDSPEFINNIEIRICQK